MLPFTIGGTALAAIGYGVGKILADDDFRDDVKDKIQDFFIKEYERIERLEEKFGLNTYEFSSQEEADDALRYVQKFFDALV
ncbi:MAG: hypothetical protein IE909_13485 [Campylobacterales bacterium]|nr:hypothetical protein [Campylobacterales bacterium]